MNVIFHHQWGFICNVCLGPTVRALTLFAFLVAILPAAHGQVLLEPPKPNSFMYCQPKSPERMLRPSAPPQSEDSIAQGMIEGELAAEDLGTGGLTPVQLGYALGTEENHGRCGVYLAVALIDRLGLKDTGGLTRLGPVHYNTFEEVDRAVELVERA